MTKYTYIDLKTGKKVFSDKPIKDDNLKLVRVIKSGQMEGNQIVQK